MTMCCAATADIFYSAPSSRYDERAMVTKEWQKNDCGWVLGIQSIPALESSRHRHRHWTNGGKEWRRIAEYNVDIIFKYWLDSGTRDSSRTSRDALLLPKTTFAINSKTKEKKRKLKSSSEQREKSWGRERKKSEEEVVVVHGV